MSEPTLYQIDDELAEMLAQDEGPSLGAYVRRLIQVGVLVPVEPDPEDVVTEYLVKRGIPKDDAWMAAHHLIHTVLYCLSADSLTGIGGDDASHYPDDWYEAHGENQR